MLVLIGRRGAEEGNPTCTATYLRRSAAERRGGGFRCEKILSVRNLRPAHLPRFRHSHGVLTAGGRSPRSISEIDGER
jgi:hypothetical protein